MSYLAAVKGIGIAALIIILVGAGWSARGWKDSRDVLQKAADTAKAEKSVSEQIKKDVSDIDKTNTERLRSAKIELDDINRRIANGQLQLSVQGTCNKPGQASSTGMGNDQTRTEIDPEISRNLIVITAEGDEAIHQLTACQEILGSAKCNGIQ